MFVVEVRLSERLETLGLGLHDSRCYGSFLDHALNDSEAGGLYYGVNVLAGGAREWADDGIVIHSLDALITSSSPGGDGIDNGLSLAGGRDDLHSHLRWIRGNHASGDILSINLLTDVVDISNLSASLQRFGNGSCFTLIIDREGNN